MYLNRAHLDSQQVVETAVPDKPQALEQEEKQGVKKVSIKEVLEHKDGDRVWVVIQGEVYEYVYDDNIRTFSWARLTVIIIIV